MYAGDMASPHVLEVEAERRQKYVAQVIPDAEIQVHNVFMSPLVKMYVPDRGLHSKALSTFMSGSSAETMAWTEHTCLICAHLPWR